MRTTPNDSSITFGASSVCARYADPLPEFCELAKGRVGRWTSGVCGNTYAERVARRFPDIDPQRPPHESVAR